MNLAALTLENKFEWAKLLATCFDRQASDTQKLLDWLHHLFEPRAWGIWEDGNLVAQYTALKRPLSHANERVTVGMSVNMAVHPNFRGRGYIKHIAAPIYEQLRAEGASFGIGFSNAEGVQVDKHSKSYGYRVVGQMRPIFAPILPHKAEKLSIASHFPDDCLSPMPTFPTLGFPKDCAYLYQRYAAHPFRQYQFALWQEQSGTVGMVVYRPSKIMGLPVLSILDIWGEDLPELLRRFQATTWQSGFRLIHALVSPQNKLNNLLNWRITSPYTRHPYYLTLKPLAADLASEIYIFENWDLIGGDIL